VVADYLDEDLMPHQQDHAMMQQDREVQLTPDRYIPDTFFQTTSFAPFPSASDAIWCQKVVEEGLGANKRRRMYETFATPQFDSKEMAITTEDQRRSCMAQLPGGVIPV
jgi:hypothetical protein